MYYFENKIFVIISSSDSIHFFQDQINHLSRLMFIDRDSMPVNNYAFAILGDYKNIFGVNCSVFEDDREGEPQTAISCSTYYKRYFFQIKFLFLTLGFRIVVS